MDNYSMGLRHEFSNLLSTIKVPQNTTDVLQQSTYNKISQFIVNNVPAALFRYRKFDEQENNLNALKNDQLWMALPKVMNDVFDSLLFFDKDRIKEEYYTDTHNLDKICDHLFNGGNFSAGILEMFDEKTLSELLPMMKNLKGNIAIRPYLKKVVNDYLNPLFESVLESLPDDTISILQEARRIACFSETITSNKMWGHYADYHTGFALEYDFRDSELICKKHHSNCGNLWLNYPLFPVVYGEEFDATEYVTHKMMDRMIQQLTNGSVVLPFYDWSFFTKGYLYKSDDWSEEQEWRLLSKIEKPDIEIATYNYINFKAKAIYCGMNISSENKKLLQDIAADKEIPIFEMKINSQDRSIYPVLQSVNLL